METRLGKDRLPVTPDSSLGFAKEAVTTLLSEAAQEI